MPGSQDARRSHHIRFASWLQRSSHGIVYEVPGVGLVRLAHFPYLPAEPLPDYEQSHSANWGKPRNEALLLHGHIHSQWQTKTEPDMPPMINVGIDM
jgi:calcineurin-like phosphoesterase family protein